jgi:hypothetical protein
MTLNLLTPKRKFGIVAFGPTHLAKKGIQCGTGPFLEILSTILCEENGVIGARPETTQIRGDEEEKIISREHVK